jgi:hypothetical protein
MYGLNQGMDDIETIPYRLIPNTKFVCVMLTANTETWDSVKKVWTDWQSIVPFMSRKSMQLWQFIDLAIEFGLDMMPDDPNYFAEDIFYAEDDTVGAISRAFKLESRGRLEIPAQGLSLIRRQDSMQTILSRATFKKLDDRNRIIGPFNDSDEELPASLQGMLIASIFTNAVLRLGVEVITTELDEEANSLSSDSNLDMNEFEVCPDGD